MPTPRAKHSAPGPYLGFGMQTVRLCARLVHESNDAIVFVEHDDDVSVHYGDGTILLEQTKRKKNAVSDWSVDLWKTISNWLDDHSPLATGPVTALRLYVSPPQSGRFVEALSAIKSEADAVSLIALIASEAKNKKSVAAYPYIKRFLDAPTAEQAALILRFELIAEAEPLAAVANRYAGAVDDIVLNDVVPYALGLAKKMSDALMEAGSPSGINAGQFQNLIRTYIKTVNLPALFDFNVPPPSSEMLAEKLACRPVFIRQLELVELGEDKQRNAVNDYLRAAASTTKWGFKGILLPDALDAFEAELVSRHGAICDYHAALNAPTGPIQRGQAVYARCREVAAELQGKSVPSHFVHGSYCNLADQLRLGWHPDYAELLA